MKNYTRYEDLDKDERYKYLISDNELGGYGVDLKARKAIRIVLESLGAHDYFISPNQLPVYGTESFTHLREDINLILGYLKLKVEIENKEIIPRKLVSIEQDPETSKV